MNTLTHPIQLYAISIACAANVIGLAVINRHKRRKQVGRAWSWELRRDAFWALMAVLLAIEVWLDSRYPISTHMLPIKAYSFAFSVGLLDLFFSDTRGVPLKVIAGHSRSASTGLGPARHCGWVQGYRDSVSYRVRLRIREL